MTDQPAAGGARRVVRAVARRAVLPALARLERAVRRAAGAARPEAETPEPTSTARPEALPEPIAEPSTEPTAADEFHAMVHELRTVCLRAVPRPAGILVSAGASGGWYFDWIVSNLAGVKRHIGVERYLPRPDVLPPGCEWIESSVDDMQGVPDDIADTIFSGQNIEHLWPEQMAGFLCEANRVLRPGGRLIIDSPNGAVTPLLGYHHGEHTIELTVDEAQDLVRLAGFEPRVTRGIWQVRDDDAVFGLEPSGAGRFEVLDRAVLGAQRPEWAFVWWIEAERVGTPDPAALGARIADLFRDHWPERVSRPSDRAGVDRADAARRFAAGSTGELLLGGYFPLPPGRWLAAVPIVDDDGDVVDGIDLAIYHSEQDVGVTRVANRDGHARWVLDVPDFRFAARWALTRWQPGVAARLAGHLRVGLDAHEGCTTLVPVP
jgi:hypothetical protein